MTRQLPSTVAVLLTVGSLLSACSPGPPGVPDFSQMDVGERPNVLFVLIDALRRDHLGIYGYPLPTSPNIDSLASESFVFTRAYSHSTWTKPSMATLFTSVYPEQHGLGRVGFADESGFRTDVLPKRLVTLAERMRNGGYATAGFSTNVHIDRKTGFAQGFDHFFQKRLVDAFDLNRLLETWLEERDPEAPFFAYLHYMDAHWPYDRRLDSEEGRFGNTRSEPPAPEHWSLVGEWAVEHLNDESLAAIRAGYDEEIAFIDSAFGELLTWLDEREMLSDLVVVLVADHGEGFNEHGELQHGFAPYEEVTGVPLLIRLPEVYRAEAGSIDDLVGLVDLMPTILDLVGIGPPRRAQGRSIVPLLFGQPMRERPVYLEGAGVHGMRGPTHSVLVEDGGGSICFDSAADPGETRPLDEPWPESCGRLVATLEALVARFEPLASPESPDATVTLNEDEIEALRALGYLD